MYILSALTALLLTPLLATAASPAEHYLKTSVVKSAHKDTGSNKNNLFVQSYHTGAGINDVVLVPEKKGAAPFFLNDTTAQFDLKSPGISWFMTMGGDTNYAGWESVGINTFNGSPDFFINATGLQWNQTYYGFGGWLACDWWHSLPQLFWLDIYEPSGVIPSSCSKVTLNLVPM